MRAALFTLALAATPLVYSPPAAADEGYQWGCKILLCLGGPSAGDCPSELRKLYRDLARGKPFPPCTMTGAPGTYAKRVHNPYDPCPDGTRPVLGLVAEASRPSAYRLSTDEYQLESEGVSGFKPLACAGEKVRSYDIASGDAGSQRVTVYESITWMAPQSPRAIDLYVDGELFSRTRY